MNDSLYQILPTLSLLAGPFMRREQLKAMLAAFDDDGDG